MVTHKRGAVGRLFKGAVLAIFTLCAIGLVQAASSTYTISNNTPGFIKKAVNKGPVDPASTISVTVWLKLHNQNQLDQLVKNQTQKGSSSYHKWITQDQFNAQFAPTAQEVKSVSNFLSAHKLSLVEVAENNFYVKVQGAVADVEKAFHVQLNNYALSGQTYRGNAGNPSVNDSSGSHIAAITGLDDYGFEPLAKHPVDADGNATKMVPLASMPNGTFFEGQCFRDVETHTFNGGGTSATYTGNRFGSDITSDTLGDLPPCGYSPDEMQTAYNMKALYNAGFDGTGETVVITDAYGSATIAQDADLFSLVYGLPRITDDNFQLVKAGGLVNSPHAGTWPDEVTLDVEWVHAMAPKAKIVLVIANNRGSLDEAINLAVVHHYGNTISNSWSTLEGFGNPAQFDRINRILEQAAAQGIDVNFSTGDFGDETVRVGFKTVDFPPSSPFATAIGGTSLALNPDNTIKFQTGWGNNETRIADTLALGNPPQNPPLRFGFVFGAGGGSSLIYPKPSWQVGVPGTTRGTPDISMVGDPFTGVEIIQTVDGTPSVGVIGGTSLSTPMFSGLMAIAAQKAGHGLGQVAPLLYDLPSGIIDVTQTGLPGTNVSGSIGATPYSADFLASPLGNTTSYYSAMYNSPFSTRWFVLSFGTDTSLTTTPGWDNVTGLGTPDGVNFVNAIAP